MFELLASLALALTPCVRLERGCNTFLNETDCPTDKNVTRKTYKMENLVDEVIHACTWVADKGCTSVCNDTEDAYVCVQEPGTSVGKCVEKNSYNTGTAERNKKLLETRDAKEAIESLSEFVYKRRIMENPQQPRYVWESPTKPGHLFKHRRCAATCKSCNIAGCSLAVAISPPVVLGDALSVDSALLNKVLTNNHTLKNCSLYAEVSPDNRSIEIKQNSTCQCKELMTALPAVVFNYTGGNDTPRKVMWHFVNKNVSQCGGYADVKPLMRDALLKAVTSELADAFLYPALKDDGELKSATDVPTTDLVVYRTNSKHFKHLPHSPDLGCTLKFAGALAKLVSENDELLEEVLNSTNLGGKNAAVSSKLLGLKLEPIQMHSIIADGVFEVVTVAYDNSTDTATLGLAALQILLGISDDLVVRSRRSAPLNPFGRFARNIPVLIRPMMEKSVQFKTQVTAVVDSHPRLQLFQNLDEAVMAEEAAMVNSTPPYLAFVEEEPNADWYLVYHSAFPAFNIYQKTGSASPDAMLFKPEQCLQLNEAVKEGGGINAASQKDLASSLASLVPGLPIPMKKDQTATFMGGINAEQVAEACVAEGSQLGQSYEWLHRIAYSIAGPKADNGSNLLLGTSQANTHMITYETVVKNWLARNTTDARSRKRTGNLKIVTELVFRSAGDEALAPYAPTKLGYTIQYSPPHDHGKVHPFYTVAGINFDMMLAHTPSFVTNAVAFAAHSFVDPDNVPCNTDFAPKKNETLRSSFGMLNSTFQSEVQELLGLTNLSEWTTVGKDEVVDLYNATRSLYPAEVPAYFEDPSGTIPATHVVRQGTANITVRGALLPCTVRTYLIPHASGNFSHMSELIPSDASAGFLGSLPLLSGGTQRLLMMTTELGTSPVVLHWTLNLVSTMSRMFSYIPGFDDKFGRALDSIVTTVSFCELYDLRSPNFDGNIHLSTPLPIPGGKITLVTNGEVELSLVDEIVLVASISNVLDMAQGNLTKRVDFQFTAAAQFKWGPTTDEEVTLQLIGGTVAGSPFATATLLDWVNPLGLDVVLNVAKLTFRLEPLSVDLGAVITITNTTELVLDGAYNDGAVSLRGLAETELTLDDILSWYGNYSGTVVEKPDNAPNLTLTEVGMSICTGERYTFASGATCDNGISMWGTAELNGGKIGVDVLISKTNIVFAGFANNLKVADAVYLDAASLLFEINPAGPASPVVEIEGQLSIDAAVLFLAGEYTGGTVAVIAESTAPLTLVDLAQLHTTITAGDPIEVPSNVPSFTLNEFSVSVCTAPGGHTFASGATCPNGVQVFGSATFLEADVEMTIGISATRLAFHGAVTNFTLSDSITVDAVTLDFEFIKAVEGKPLAFSIAVGATITIATDLKFEFEGTYAFGEWAIYGGLNGDLTMAHIIQLYEKVTGVTGIQLSNAPDITLSNVAASYCSSADMCVIDGAVRPSGFMISGDARFEDTTVSLELIISKTGMSFTGSVANFSIGSFTIDSAAVKFELRKNDTQRVAVTATGTKVVPGFAAFTVTLKMGAEKTIEATGMSAGFGDLLGFVEDLTGQVLLPGGDSGFLDSVKITRLKIIHSPSPPVETPYPPGFSFEVALDVFGETFDTALLLQEKNFDFCFGPCEGQQPLIPNDPLAIYGNATIGGATTGVGIQVVVRPKLVSIGNIAYVAVSPFDAATAADLVDALGDLAVLGLADGTLRIQASTAGFELGISASPNLPATSDNDFLTVVREVAEEIVFAIEAKVDFSGNMELTLKVGAGAIGKPIDNFQIMDPRNSNLGFAIFTTFFYAAPATVGATLGVAFPLKVCVENCDPLPGVSKRYIYLVGEVELTVTETAQIMKGRLTLDGAWTNPFGIPFLRFSDVVLGAGWDFKSPTPSSILIGGSICLGSAENCAAMTMPSVTGRAYVGVSATEPKETFFIGLVSELTIGVLVGIVAEYVPPLANVNLPSRLVASGIYPVNASNCDLASNQDDPLDACKCGEGEACTLPVSAECKAALEERCPDGVCTESEPIPFDIDCFSYISFSALAKTLQFRSGDVVIPRGVAFAGRLNFLGWEIALQVTIAPTTFLIDGQMDHAEIKLPNSHGDPVTFLRLGRELEAGKAIGDAQFLVDVGVGKLPRIEIHGAFDIPLLASYGELQVTLDTSIFSFESTIHLFSGFLTTNALVKWDWDFTYFTMALDDLDFAFGLVTIRQLMFAYNRTISYAQFECDLSVLYGTFAVSTQVAVKDNVIDFSFSQETLGITSTVAGEATVVNPFEESDFAVSTTVDWGPIGGLVNQLVDDVKKFAQNAWNEVETKVAAFWGQIVDIFNGMLSNIRDRLNNLLSNLENFLNDFVAAIKNVPVLGNIVRLGEALFRGDVGALTDAALAIGAELGLVGDEGHKEVPATKDGKSANEYGCPYRKISYRTCWRCCRICLWGACTPGFEHCDDKETPVFVKRECMEDVAAAAAEVEELATNMQKKRAIKTHSQARNPGLKRLVEGLVLPEPVLQKTTFVQTKQDAKMGPGGVRYAEATSASSGEVDVLTGPMGSGARGVHVMATGDFQGKETVTVPTSVSFSGQAAFAASMEAVKVKIGEALKDKALSAQEGLLKDSSLRREAAGAFTDFEQVPYDPPEKPVLGDIPQPPVFTCNEKIDLNKYKPSIVTDPDCTEGQKVLMLSAHALTLAEQEEHDPNRVCGTKYLKVRWQGFDDPSCGGFTDIATVVVEIAPANPSFATFPDDRQITTMESVNPSEMGEPTALDVCNQEVDITSYDYLEEHPTTCGRWKLTRNWVIAPFHRNCKPSLEQPGEERNQTITIIDAAAPEWTYTPPVEVVVPFFESWRGGVNQAPLTEERTHETMEVWGIALGMNLTSYPTTLVATDGPLEHASALPADEATCRARGLASFTRTWTATDKCGNSKTFEQVIKVQHPPETLATTQQWTPLAKEFTFSSGVDQVEDACNAGKTVTGGTKSFDPIDSSQSVDTACPVDVPALWTEDGCRRTVPDPRVDYSSYVGSVKPGFATFPEDTVTYTNLSLNAYDPQSRLGVATGHAYCNTPFSIRYDDAAPVLQSCGVWTIDRTWKIQPHFMDCGDDTAVYAAHYVTTRVQVLTVKDVEAPEWTYIPETAVSIPFFENSRVENSMPLTNEVAHPDMLALGLVSYPTRTTSHDGTLEVTDAGSADEAMCRREGVARFTRTWTTADLCGNSRSFVQRVTIEHPPTGLTATQHWNAADRLFAYAPGVEQVQDACYAGKTVVLGDKEFAAIDSSPTLDNACPADALAWDENACRRFDPDTRVATTVDVHSIRPYFQSFPADAMTYTNSTLDAYDVAGGLGYPVGAAFCGTPFTIRYDDAAPVLQSCGVWTIDRTWKIQPHFMDCGDDTAVYAAHYVTTRVQVLTVKDVEAPEWTYIPETAVSIPFFENSRVENSMPLTNEVAHPDMLALGLVSYPTRTTSHDGTLEVTDAGSADEAMCRREGVARFTRTWTTADLCGNSRSFVQRVTIEHPPTGLTATQHWNAADRLFAYAPGVEQVQDACYAGKTVVLGDKEFAAIDSSPTLDNACPADALAWDENACRRFDPDTRVATTVDVHSIRPYFQSFPADAMTYTNSTLDAYDVAGGLGYPVGAAFCGTPFTIRYDDAAPVLQSCGVWTIDRTWKIQPHFMDCGDDTAVYAAALTTRRVQIITVKDVFPPHFVATPAVDQWVEFWSDYGPSVHGVPQIEDVATHPDMAALGLTSYAVTLEHEDVHVAFEGSAESCNTGLAVVSRLWTAKDRCLTAATWMQTIRVRNPTAEGAVGNLRDLNSYQVFSSGSIAAIRVSPFEGSIGSESRIELKSATPTGAVTARMKHNHNKVIAAFSDKLFAPLANWHTGPKHVTCATANQSSCVVDTMTPPGPAATLRSEKATNNMYLEGGDLVYSVFMGVDVNRWMYKPPWRETTKPDLVVRAGGFVVVNMEYTGKKTKKSWGRLERHTDSLRTTVYEQPQPAGSKFTVYNLRRADRTFNTVYLDIDSSTVHGTLLSQDRFCKIKIHDSLVYGQVVASSKKMTLLNMGFFNNTFAANVVCNASEGA
ncbi:hypothetical protein DIPPA_17775 [Diplonema papillatum]|nr:hypothetical protein DIPPA_17775 [Diplonema papillatum]